MVLLSVKLVMLFWKLIKVHTSALNKHIKIHKIDITTVDESCEEPPAKKAKIQNYFGPKEKPLAITELLAKMTSVDGISFGAN